MQDQNKKTVMSRAIMPSMTNHRGILFGGMMLEWMDEVAGIAARRFAGPEVTTVAVEQVRFLKPVPVGAFVDVTGQVVAVGNTSLRVQVQILMDKTMESNESENREETEGLSKSDENLEKIPVAESTFVYVAIDREGKPRKVERTL